MHTEASDSANDSWQGAAFRYCQDQGEVDEEAIKDDATALICLSGV